MRRLKKKYFAVQLDDDESDINGCIVGVVSIDTVKRNFLKDEIARILMEKKLSEILTLWRGDKLLKHQIEILSDSETGREFIDTYVLTATYYNDEDSYEYDSYFSLTEVKII